MAQASGEGHKIYLAIKIYTSLKNRSATGHVRPVCDLARTESHVEDVATLTGLGVGLSLLAVFIWFTLRLFSKARNVESRYNFMTDVYVFKSQIEFPHLKRCITILPRL